MLISWNHYLDLHLGSRVNIQLIYVDRVNIQCTQPGTCSPRINSRSSSVNRSFCWLICIGACLFTWPAMCLCTWPALSLYIWHAMCLHTSHALCMYTLLALCLCTWHALCLCTWPALCLCTSPWSAAACRRLKLSGFSSNNLGHKLLVGLFEFQISCPDKI